MKSEKEVRSALEDYEKEKEMYEQMAEKVPSRDERKYYEKEALELAIRIQELGWVLH